MPFSVFLSLPFPWSVHLSLCLSLSASQSVSECLLVSPCRPYISLSLCLSLCLLDRVSLILSLSLFLSQPLSDQPSPFLSSWRKECPHQMSNKTKALPGAPQDRARWATGLGPCLVGATVLLKCAPGHWKPVTARESSMEQCGVVGVLGLQSGALSTHTAQATAVRTCSPARQEPKGDYGSVRSLWEPRVSLQGVHVLLPCVLWSFQVAGKTFRNQGLSKMLCFLSRKGQSWG